MQDIKERKIGEEDKNRESFKRGKEISFYKEDFALEADAFFQLQKQNFVLEVFI